MPARYMNNLVKEALMDPCRDAPSPQGVNRRGVPAPIGMISL